MVDHVFSYIVYGKCMIYHGLPVSKHHGIYLGIRWYIFISVTTFVASKRLAGSVSACETGYDSLHRIAVNSFFVV